VESIKTIIIFGIIALYFGAAPAVFAEDAEARKIMEKVSAVEEGQNGTAQVEMILIDKNKRQRVRKMAAYNKTIEGEKRGVSFFLYPADVKGTAFLQVRPKGKTESKQWLYMPDLKKTKRILSTGGAQTGSFMGSDFTYADMQGITIDDYTYEFYEKQKEIEFNGHKHWVVKAIPKSKEVIDKKGYTEILLFVRQDNYFIVRSKLNLKDGGYVKYMDIKELKQIDGIWVPMETHMTTKIGDKTFHKTILKNTNVKFNQDLSDNLFTIRKLETGL
jgi:hypothetical protein